MAVVVVGVGVELVVHPPAVGDARLEADVLKVGLLVLVVVFPVERIEVVGSVVVLQAEVAHLLAIGLQVRVDGQLEPAIAIEAFSHRLCAEILERRG